MVDNTDTLSQAISSDCDYKVEWIAHFNDSECTKPTALWEYHHREDERPFGRIVGYWDAEGKFVENKSHNKKLMDYQNFVKRVLPIDNVKHYEMEEEFFLDLI